MAKEELLEMSGVVQDVLNVPYGIEYEIRDYDNPPDESAESGRRP